MRRFEARDIYVSGTLSAYLLVAMINSVLPYLSRSQYRQLSPAWGGHSGLFFLLLAERQSIPISLGRHSRGLGLAMRRQWYRDTLQHSLLIVFWVRYLFRRRMANIG